VFPRVRMRVFTSFPGGLFGGPRRFDIVLDSIGGRSIDDGPAR